MEKSENEQRLRHTNAKKSSEEIDIKTNSFYGICLRSKGRVVSRNTCCYSTLFFFVFTWGFATLSKIKSPQDIKALSKKELRSLTVEIRKCIIETVAKNGGHLSSNLGVVELTIALHRAFSSPHDAIVFDVGHQCYTHKLLTGRYESFGTLRQKNGISGFTKRQESEHDYFDSGHASTSISSALGLLTARRITKDSGKVVAVIGDGALTGGLAFEGLSHAGILCRDLIVVLNDNQMSISSSTGAISRYLSLLTTTPHYQRFRHIFDKIVGHIPLVGTILSKLVFKVKRGIKGVFFANNFFTDLGFEYAGPFDGHNIAELEKIFLSAKKINHPIVIHVITKKGKGYSPAEDDPAAFHGIGPFCISDGTVDSFNTKSFTQCFSNTMLELGKISPRVVAITAAMSKGTGLDAFARHYPDRFFDVGIAEEHAITFAAGLATGSLIPIVAIYSTFIQRAIDQIIHDVALQNRHIILCLDRAGAVPYDGATHQGVFDIALLRAVPRLILLSPASASDLRLCLLWAIQEPSPIVIRYPKTTCPTELIAFSTPVHLGQGVLVPLTQLAPSIAPKFEENDSYKRLLLVVTGDMFSEAQKAARSLSLEGVFTNIFIIRFIKPFDDNFFLNIAKKYSVILIIDDSVRTGSIAVSIDNLLTQMLPYILHKAITFPDEFLSHESRAEMFEEYKLDANNIVNQAIKLLEKL